MKTNSAFVIKSSICAVLVTAAVIAIDHFYFMPARYKSAIRDIRHEIKDEVKQEVMAEIQDNIAVQLQGPEIAALIKEEVNSQVTEYLADLATSRENLAQNSTSDEFPDKDLQTVIRNMVLDIIAEDKRNLDEMANEQLARYTAGEGIEPDVRIQNGLQKSASTERILLAQNNAGAAPGSAPAQGTSNSQDEFTSAQDAPIERTESLERTLQQRGSILLPKGKLQVEPSFTYAHFSSNRINIQGFSILPVLVVGDISVDEVNRDVFIQTTALKYGLLDNFQTELKIPFRGEYDRITNSATDESDRSTSGLGDVEFGFSRQIGWEQGLMPDLVASFGVKTPTGKSPYNSDIALGTGHWSLRSSLIAAKASDPAVIFSSLNYTYNFQRNDIDNYGDIKPGDSIGYSVGTAIALSYQVAINFAFDQSVTLKMKRNGREVTGSFLNTMNFKTGLTWAIDENKSLDFGVSMGLTKDSPDSTVEVRVPISF